MLIFFMVGMILKSHDFMRLKNICMDLCLVINVVNPVGPPVGEDAPPNQNPSPPPPPEKKMKEIPLFYVLLETLFSPTHRYIFYMHTYMGCLTCLPDLCMHYAHPTVRPTWGDGNQKVGVGLKMLDGLDLCTKFQAHQIILTS